MQPFGELPVEADKLFPRQRELVRAIYATAGATLQELHARIPDPPATIYGIRTLLNRMVKKGLLKARRSGRHREIVYLPATITPEVALRAFQRLAEEHFDGSMASAMATLANLALSEGTATGADAQER